jgi:hypothetical protein
VLLTLLVASTLLISLVTTFEKPSTTKPFIWPSFRPSEHVGTTSHTSRHRQLLQVWLINILINFKRNIRIVLHILWVASPSSFSLFTTFRRSNLGHPELLLRCSTISALINYSHHLCGEFSRSLTSYWSRVENILVLWHPIGHVICNSFILWHPFGHVGCPRGYEERVSAPRRRINPQKTWNPVVPASGRHPSRVFRRMEKRPRKRRGQTGACSVAANGHFRHGFGQVVILRKWHAV